LISQVLVAGLIAVAFSEPVASVTQELDNHGIGIHSLAWLVVYIATALRFFVGDILHLETADLTTPEAEVRWFWDFSFIISECVVLIFAGTVTAAHVIAPVSFVEYLLVLYALDILWLSSFPLFHVLGQPTRLPKLFGRMVRKDDMSLLLLGWVVINVSLAAFMWALGLIPHDIGASNLTLWTIVAANIIAFCVDVFLSVRNRAAVADSPPPYGS
jgi:hypothetical protein